jgi:hypothetical protein
MQLGLYLHEGITLRVRRIVSEDSESLRMVAIQPFLLIVRTQHIVTVTSVPVGTIATSSVGYTGFPAYSRIYRQQRLTYCLTTF